jgi:myo-inositol-hexaphosphate 3-phosphohydrolase
MPKDKYIHAGYKLLLNELSVEDVLKLKPFLEYKLETKKKGVIIDVETKYIKLNKDSVVAIKYFSSSNSGRFIDRSSEVKFWYDKRKDVTSPMSIKYIYTCSKYKLVVAEGQISGKGVYVVMSKARGNFTPYQIKKMANLGILGKKHLCEMKIDCNTYAFVERKSPSIMGGFFNKGVFIEGEKQLDLS